MLLVEILDFLLYRLLGPLLVGLLLVRAWLPYVGVPARNPLAQFVYALTNWIVRPLYRLMAPGRRIDWAAVLAALVVTLAIVLVMRLAVGADLLPDVILASTIRLFLLWGLDAVFWVTIIYVVISWVNPQAPFAPAVAMLLRPLLAPIQRLVPTVGGFDLSPMVLLIAVYILRIIIMRL
jgi:YggT family protein